MVGHYRTDRLTMIRYSQRKVTGFNVDAKIAADIRSPSRKKGRPRPCFGKGREEN